MKQPLLISVALLATLACSTVLAPFELVPPTATVTPITPTVTVTPTLASPTLTVTSIPPLPTIQSTPLTYGMAFRDVIYCTPNGQPMRMDIFFPQTGAQPWPVILYVHGGGWIGGSKILGPGVADVPALTAGGYMVAAVSYRLLDDYPFPAMIEDIKCAVRYLRANAAEYTLDPTRIGAYGSSAGGHLVDLLGLSDESAGWDVGEYLDQSSRVQAVVSLFGLSDLRNADYSQSLRRSAYKLFGATDENDSILDIASSVTYISADDPPFFILNGDKDEVIPASEAQSFYDLLTLAGIRADLLIVQNAGHGFVPIDADFTTPSRAEITEMIIAFFDRYLKGD